jgi:3-isopropylmalate dehydrogenase
MEANVRSYNVAHLPGDGIGPEVTAVAKDLVDQAGKRYGFIVDWRHCPLGSAHYLRTGEVLPGDVLTDLRKTDAIFLGAVGSPSVPPGVLERGLLLRLRFELDLFVNLRPAKQRPGVHAAGADNLDFVVVRENTEGLYAGAGGIAHQGSSFEVATEESLNTRAGVERCVRYAAGLAKRRSGKLTLVHKTNVLVNAGSLWKRVADEVAAEQGLKFDYCHVDAACLYMVSDPGRFDVIVTDNLFGDIITDLAAALTGGLGLSASGNLNPDKTGTGGPSMFEPVHGSAPDIAGTGKSNPAGAVLSASLMLDHLGEPEAAAELEAAVDAVLAAGGAASTDAWAEALAAQLALTEVAR